MLYPHRADAARARYEGQLQRLGLSLELVPERFPVRFVGPSAFDFAVAYVRADGLPETVEIEECGHCVAWTVFPNGDAFRLVETGSAGPPGGEPALYPDNTTPVSSPASAPGASAATSVHFTHPLEPTDQAHIADLIREMTARGAGVARITNQQRTVLLCLPNPNEKA